MHEYGQRTCDANSRSLFALLAGQQKQTDLSRGLLEQKSDGLAVSYSIYGKSTDNFAHAQSVCTRPFFPRWEGTGDEATATGTRVISKHPPSLVFTYQHSKTFINITGNTFTKLLQHKHTHTHTHTHTQTHTHTCKYIHTHTHACTHAHANVHTHTLYYYSS